MISDEEWYLFSKDKSIIYQNQIIISKVFKEYIINIQVL